MATEERDTVERMLTMSAKGYSKVQIAVALGTDSATVSAQLKELRSPRTLKERIELRRMAGNLALYHRMSVADIAAALEISYNKAYKWVCQSVGKDVIWRGRGKRRRVADFTPEEIKQKKQQALATYIPRVSRVVDVADALGLPTYLVARWLRDADRIKGRNSAKSPYSDGAIAHQTRVAVERTKEGWTVRRIARELGISYETAVRRLAEAGVEPAPDERIIDVNSPEVKRAVYLFHSGFGVEEVAKRLGREPSTIYSWLRKADVPIGPKWDRDRWREAPLPD